MSSGTPSRMPQAVKHSICTAISITYACGHNRITYTDSSRGLPYSCCQLADGRPQRVHITNFIFKNDFCDRPDYQQHTIDTSEMILTLHGLEVFVFGCKTSIAEAYDYARAFMSSFDTTAFDFDGTFRSTQRHFMLAYGNFIAMQGILVQRNHHTATRDRSYEYSEALRTVLYHVDVVEELLSITFQQMQSIEMARTLALHNQLRQIWTNTPNRILKPASQSITAISQNTTLPTIEEETEDELQAIVWTAGNMLMPTQKPKTSTILPEESGHRIVGRASRLRAVARPFVPQGIRPGPWPVAQETKRVPGNIPAIQSSSPSGETRNAAQRPRQRPTSLSAAWRRHIQQMPKHESQRHERPPTPRTTMGKGQEIGRGRRPVHMVSRQT